MEISLSKLLSFFLYLISLLSFSVGFYKLIFMSDVTSATLAYLVAFLAIVFANYRDLEAVSALGFSAKKFQSLKSEADTLIESLKFQSEILIGEVIFSKLDTNRFVDGDARWQQLKDLRAELKKKSDFNYFAKHLKLIKSYFIFDFINVRIKPELDKLYAAAFQAVNNKQNDLIKSWADVPDWPAKLSTLKVKIFSNLSIPDFDIGNCDSMHSKYFLSRIDSIKDDLSNFDLKLDLTEFDIVMSELDEIHNSADVLSERNIYLIERAYRSILSS